VEIPGLEEARQLSFSNAMNINRGVTEPSQAQSILREYQARKQSTGAFAEWFSIDPAFPAGIFGEEKMVPGAYCNGGIMPLVGGELARACLENGFEEHGIAILRQYEAMISASNETYLWYFPDGKASSLESSTSPDAMPTDGWGSSAMLYGFMEGLVGIQDHGCMMDQVRLCPRWTAADVSSAEVNVGYEASGASLAYAYRERVDSLNLQIETARAGIQLHLLLPQGAEAREVTGPDGPLEFSQSVVGNSRYVDCSLKVEKIAGVNVRFA